MGKLQKKKEKSSALTPLDPDGRSSTLRENRTRAALLTMLRDLEESRRRIEHARREWSETLDGITDPICLHDAEFRILRANRAYAEQAGLPIKSLIGRPYWEVFPKGEGPLPGCVQALDRGTTVEDEIASNGRLFRSRFFTVSDDGGEYLFSVHVMEDITEQRRAEHEQRVLSEALRQTANAALLVGPDKSIRFANPAFTSLFGYERDEVIGQPISLLAVEGDSSDHRPADIGDAVRRGERWSGEVLRRARDGTAIPVMLTAAPVQDQKGQHIGSVSTYTDLRPVKEVQEQINTLRAVIEDISTELDMETLGNKAMEAASRLLDAEMGGVVVLEEDGSRLRYRWLFGMPEKLLSVLEAGFDPAHGAAGAVVRDGQAKIVDDYQHYAAALPAYRTAGVERVLSVPIMAGAELLGVLSLARGRGRPAFSPSDARLAETIARQLGVALQRDRLIANLSDSEALFRRVVESVSDVLFALRPSDLAPTFVSPAAQEVFGYAPVELLGDPKLWIRQLHADDRQRVLGEIQRGLRDGEAVVVDTRLVHRDGSVRWANGRINIVRNERGDPGAIFGVLNDITARKLAEEALQDKQHELTALMDNLPGMVYRCRNDPDWTIEFVSDGCRALTGYDPEDLIDNRRLSYGDLIHPDDSARVWEKVQDAVRRGDSYQLEYRIIDARGAPKWVWEQGAPLLDRDGTLVRLEGLVMDVTERHEAEQRAEREHRRAQEYLDVAGVTLVALDRDGRVSMINRKGAQTLGYNEHELIGRDWFDTCLPEDMRDEVREVFAGLMAGQDDVLEYFDNPVITRNGERRVIAWHNVLMHDGDGRISGVLSSGEDVTETRRAEVALRASEERLGILFEHAPDGIYLTDMEGRFVDGNRAAEKIVGRSRTELVGRSIFDADVLPERYTPKVRVELARNAVGRGSGPLEIAMLRPDGSEVPVEVHAYPVTIGGRQLLLGVARDITERKKAEQALKESESRFRAIFDNSIDGVLVAEAESRRFRAANPAICQMLGYSEAELLELGVADIHPPGDLPGVFNAFEKQSRGELGIAEGLPLLKKDGALMYADVAAAPMVVEGRTYMVASFRDITDRKKAQDALREREGRLRAIVEAEPECVKLIDADGVVLEMNPAGLAMIGADSLDDVLGKPVYPMIEQPYRDAFRELTEAVFRGESGALEFAAVGLKGERRMLETHVVPLTDESGTVVSALGVTRDVTSRKQAEERLVESEGKLRTISQSAQDAIVMMDDAGLVTFWNEAAEKMFGYSKAEADGAELHKLIVSDEHYGEYLRGVAEFRRTGKGAVVGKLLELPARRKDGTMFDAEVSISAVQLKDRWHAVGLVRDVSERKASERATKRLNRALRTISRANEALVRATHESSLFGDICSTLVEEGGYRMAWIGLVGDDVPSSVRPIAYAGFERGFLDAGRPWWQPDGTPGGGPVISVSEGGEPVSVADIGSDPGAEPWRDAALERGYASMIALPLKYGGGVLGALTIYAPLREAFDEQEIRLLNELAGDTAYGIVSLRTKAKHQEAEARVRDTLEQLKDSLQATVKAVASTVEKRDPYTAGHQRRVADLAVAIARELGLSDSQVEGLYMAGVIHDIGKIHIPAEILAKPARLTGIEYSMIKTHPEVGYDILKEIPFPWPLAQTVLQHHERLDGSGYPSGLKGDDIILEARILAVADVVEAMASHRPYRAGLGVDAALDEVQHGAGSRYDPAVVEACVRLFYERGYSLD